MKKIAISIAVAVVVIGAAIGGDYWYKRQNEPPPVVVYKDIDEMDRDIERLESLQKAGRLKWQEAYRLGVAYIQRGRVSDAARTLDDVVKRHPDFYKTYESLGMAYYRMDDMEKAIATWEKAVKMSPQAAHLEDMIARAKQRVEFKKRISVLEQEIKQGSADWQKKFELAALYLGMRRADEAKALLEDVLKVKRDSPELYDAVAQTYAVSGDFEKAVDAEKKAVKLKPSDENLKKRLAEMQRLRDAIKKGEYHKKAGDRQ
ncbi:MAG: tetratricopeptide repeat protein [Deltaproteobacteria bacterium]|nr:tetratricopeptide repeat protein [Deltaproteobacteria bacterium]